MKVVTRHEDWRGRSNAVTPMHAVLMRVGARITMTMRGMGSVAVVVMAMFVARVGMCTWAIMMTLYAE